jgi:hypothetical protein
VDIKPKLFDRSSLKLISTISLSFSVGEGGRGGGLLKMVLNTDMIIDNAFFIHKII